MFVQAQKVLDGMKSTQLKLAVSPNSKQINILQPAGYSAPGKKIYQIINSTGKFKLFNTLFRLLVEGTVALFVLHGFRFH